MCVDLQIYFTVYEKLKAGLIHYAGRQPPSPALIACMLADWKALRLTGPVCLLAGWLARALQGGWRAIP